MNDFIRRVPPTRRPARDARDVVSTTVCSRVSSTARVAIATRHDDDGRPRARCAVESSAVMGATTRRRRLDAAPRRVARILVACMLVVALGARPARGARASSRRGAVARASTVAR